MSLRRGRLRGGRLLYVLAVSCLVACLQGCARKVPTAAERAAIDYGPYPGNYASAIEGYLGNLLKDPYAARIRYFRGPVKWARCSGGHCFGGYLVCADVNAVNSYGAYIGYRPHVFQFQNGILTDHYYYKGNYTSDRDDDDPLALDIENPATSGRYALDRRHRVLSIVNSRCQDQKGVVIG